MPKIPDPRQLGGLWCQEVLDRLDAYVAEALPDQDRAAVDAHLQGCDQCASFGGAYAELVRVLRGRLGEPPPLDDDRAARLDARLQRLAGDT